MWYSEQLSKINYDTSVLYVLYCMYRNICNLDLEQQNQTDFKICKLLLSSEKITDKIQKNSHGSFICWFLTRFSSVWRSSLGNQRKFARVFSSSLRTNIQYTYYSSCNRDTYIFVNFVKIFISIESYSYFSLLTLQDGSLGQFLMVNRRV